MDVFDQTNRYDPSANMEGDPEFSGILEIYIHHARNIHNICIYDNQDVYAKFSLTYNPDEALTTKIINGGGKNPEFNESLVMKVTQLDALLKCEMWMFSRAKHYMEDQLLGFALVPVSLLVGKGKISKDFSISSTDLFHSPAGTVKLSLSLETNVSTHPTVKSFPDSAANSSITSEVLLLDRRISEVVLDPVEYSRIEFPDINVVRENQQMVTQYFSLEGHGSVSRHDLVNSGSFLRLGAPHQPVDDYEMTANSSDDNGYVSLSPNGSVQNSGFLSSTMTSLSDDRNSGDSMEKKSHLPVGLLNSPNQSITKEPTACPDTATSRKGRGIQDANIPISKDNVQESSNVKALSAPLGNINLEAEQSAMQQQIVDMYMRSMQQFSESLEKMKLPMDLNKPEPDNHGNVIQNLNNSVEVEKKKDAARFCMSSGDWMCGSCQHLNFKKRDSCHRCRFPKFGGDADMASYGIVREEVMAGDWYCNVMNCGAHNYASRTNCFRCGALKQDFYGCGAGMMGPGGYANENTVPPGWKCGDWICNRYGCGVHNYASRMECYKCKTPKEYGGAV